MVTACSNPVDAVATLASNPMFFFFLVFGRCSGYGCLATSTTDVRVLRESTGDGNVDYLGSHIMARAPLPLAATVSVY